MVVDRFTELLQETEASEPMRSPESDEERSTKCTAFQTAQRRQRGSPLTVAHRA